MAQIDILGINVFKDALDDEFYMNRLSDHLKQSHHHINRPHKHDFYAVILFTAGSGVHEIEFNAFDVLPGSIFFLTPGQTHNWRLSGDAEGFVLFHSANFYNSQFSKLKVGDFVFYSHLRQSKPIILNENDRAIAIAGFETILNEISSSNRKSRYMILSVLTQIYILNERFFSATDEQINKNSYHTTFSNFQDLLERNFIDEKSPQQYANWLHISSKHLNRINKTLFNKSTSDIIVERIMLEAKRLLLYTSLNFTQIAAELGYSDYAYFSKLFRKHVGVNPSQFVNQYSGFPQM
jgi:AraC-like DNA-binding protein